MVDVRPVLVGDPETAVAGQDKSFCVHGDTLAAWSRLAETIADEGSSGEGWEAWVRQRAGHVGVETCDWGTIWAGEEDGV